MRSFPEFIVWVVPSSPIRQDALVYLIKGEEKTALIDSGAGKGSAVIWENIRETGVNPQDLTYLILTHGHVDHIGGASFFQERTRCLTVAHELDQEAIETGDPGLTAASWYGLSLPRLKIDRVLKGKIEELPLAERKSDLFTHARSHPGIDFHFTSIDRNNGSSLVRISTALFPRLLDPTSVIGKFPWRNYWL